MDSLEATSRRGPYKRWMNEEDNVDLPKTTKWRRRKCNDDDGNINADEGSVSFDMTSMACGNSCSASTDEVPSVTVPIVVDNDTDVSDEDYRSSTESDYDREGFMDASELEQFYEIYAPVDSTEVEENDNLIDLDSQEHSNSSHHGEEGEMNGNSSNLDQPLYENSKVTLGQCLLLLMSFILGNGLTSSAICNLLKLLSLILPVGNLLPDTKFLFDKYFREFRKGTEFHLYCPDCLKWLGTETTVWCDVCHTNHTQQDLINKGSFFVYIPLQGQLMELLQRPDISSKVDHRFTRVKKNENNYEDIYDGQMYKQISDGKLMKDPNSLSISFNCDGVPVFKSSNFSIWPLQGILNELPTKQRNDNVFLLGLWFGNTKPVMNTFLQPFTEEMKKLSSTGIYWLKAGEWILSTVHTCICSADSVARCILQNIKQFNGLYGCSWCYNPGESVAKGRGHCRVYTNSDEGDKLRTHKDMKKNARNAFRKNDSVKGVKGPTILAQLPEFDLVSGFVVDNLHCVDLGVSRQLGHLWFDSTNHQQPWYIGNKTESVHNRLYLIHPPNEITRIPRSVSQRAYWKGSEWHWWLLLYAPVVLSGILPQPFYGHLLLLVEAVFLLTSSSISRQDINKADACLSQFVRHFEELYGKEHATYNVHQLLHLTKTVTDWGPLSCYSSYIFEGFNMILLKLFHGTQAVPKQIAKSFLLYKGILSIACSMPRETDDDPVMMYVDALLSGCPPLKKALKLQNNVTFLGAHYVRNLTLEEKFLVEECYGADVEEEALIFNKAVVKGNVLYSVNYRRIVKRNNFTIGLSDGSIVEIINFVVVKFVNGQKITIAFTKKIILGGQWLRPDSECGPCCSHIKIVAGREPSLRIIELSNVEHKYVKIENGYSLPGTMCCRLPNLIDRD